MKALIFNSGMGSRLNGMTESNPKCMIKLYNGETIFERQIRILSECGIKKFIVTTGPFKEQLYKTAEKFKNLDFEFVENKDYKNTNYIVSMNYASNLLDSDILLLHGDLVFNKNLIFKVLQNKNPSVCLFNELKRKPHKDFKGRFKDNRLLEVSVNIFDDDCYAFQPLYKLSKKDVTLWKEKVAEFVANGNLKVYAENALNEITAKVNLQGMSYRDDYIEEIDDENDYQRVSEEIKYFDYREQNIVLSDDFIESVKSILKPEDKLFIVCSTRVEEKLKKIFSEFEYSFFSDFSPNPKYDEIKKGVELFTSKKCDVIISVGGGSTIDVAKCVKLFSVLDDEYDFLKNKFNYSNIKHITVPTTSGSGSESTQFAVIYLNGKKLSVDNGCILPDYAVLCPAVLSTLPGYQKKSTLLDSLCQAIESFWSKGANNESREYSKKCISLIMDNYCDYLKGNVDSYKNILLASNYSGKAINITRTTSAHSMSYKLTTRYGISHGHAVSLCIIPVWKLLIKKSSDNKDLRNTLTLLADIFDTYDILSSVNIVADMIKSFKMPTINISSADIDMLARSVNISRLKNNPVPFDYNEIFKLYEEIKISMQNKDIS